MTAHGFTDPVTGAACALFLNPLGVQHPRCGQLADVYLDLDAFYCPACGHNGRVDGAWVHALDGAE